MSEIPEWIEQGMYARSKENEGMYYEVYDIAVSKTDGSNFLVLTKIDNRNVKETMYDWQFKHSDLIPVKPCKCPLCGQRGEIEHSNLNRCYNADCDVATYHGLPVDDSEQNGGDKND